jgi:sugar phosphate permease
MIVCVSFPILLMGLFPIYIFAFLPLIQNIVRGTMKPLVEQYLNKYIGSAERTTVLSAYSTISCLAGVFALAVFGAIIKYASLSQALILLGATALTFGAISYRQYVRLCA